MLSASQMMRLWKDKHMKSGISLSELAAKIEGNRDAKHDLVADTRNVSMIVRDHRPVLQVWTSDNGGQYPILPVALRQIATHTKVPQDYLDRMIERAPQLAADNVNAWLHLDGSRRMVRTLAGNARAFLSDSYQRIEHEEVAEVVLPVLSDVPGIKIVSCEATDRRLYIQAVTSKIAGDIKVGDPVEAGVLIQNSEVGLGSVSISPIVWRLVCLNGMKVPDGSFTRRHVGRRIEEGKDLNDIYRDDTKQADDRAVLLKVRDTVRAALDQIRFNVRIDKMRALTDRSTTLSGDPVKAIEVLSKKIGATETERGGILRSLIAGGDLTAWGVLNAVTHQAHAADYDRAVEFEAMGGKLLDLPAKDWKEVLQAA
jgi:hypothetical protein